MEIFDHYKVAEEIVNELREEKLNRFADDITLAMEGGSTGTEIFLALRWNIDNLLKTKEYSYSKSIKDKANRLLEELEKALPGVLY